MPRSHQPLAPIIKREFYQTFVGAKTRRECWAAETTDGKWWIERVEVPGSPWQVIRNADRAYGHLHGTLRAARQSIAAGWEDTRADEYAAGQ